MDFARFFLAPSYADLLPTYTTSQVPVSLFDLAVVLTDNIGSPLKNQQYGKNFTKLNETDKRERHFFINTSNSSQVVIDEYSTTEHANNKEAVVKAIAELTKQGFYKPGLWK